MSGPVVAIGENCRRGAAKGKQSGERQPRKHYLYPRSMGLRWLVAIHTAADLNIGQEQAKPSNPEQASNRLGCYRANLNYASRIHVCQPDRANVSVSEDGAVGTAAMAPRRKRQCRFPGPAFGQLS
jgi:hypothetical protein